MPEEAFSQPWLQTSKFLKEGAQGLKIITLEPQKPFELIFESEEIECAPRVRALRLYYFLFGALK